MTLIDDPFLTRLRDADNAAFVGVLEELSKVTDWELALLISRYIHTDRERLERLAQHPKDAVRMAVAERRDCPSALLHRLASDSDFRTRCAVAKNPSTDDTDLMILAGDENDWVRYYVFHNSTSNDEIKAAVCLLSTPDQLVTKEPPVIEDEAQNSETPLAVIIDLAEKARDETGAHTLRAALAQNPKLPEYLVEDLLSKSTWTIEWAAWWNRYRPQDWPSTHAFLNAQIPPWILEALADQGHPAALLRPDLPVAPFQIDPADAVMTLIDSKILVNALWRELASAGVADLTYWRDYHEGDRFFAQASIGQDLCLIDVGGPAEKIIGGLPWKISWISLTDYMTVEGFIRGFAGWFEEWPELFEDVMFDKQSLDDFTLSGIAFIHENSGQTEALSLTERGAQKFIDQSDNHEFDPEDYETSVTIVDRSPVLAAYGDTSEEQKSALVRLLQEARSHVLVDNWGLSRHFLKCIAIHPQTSVRLLSQLSEDPDTEVREAARICLAQRTNQSAN